MANKLFSNLDMLSAFSGKLQDRLQKQEQELQERQKSQAQKQQESNKGFESKISMLQGLQQSLKNDIDFKSQQLKEAQENAHQQKQDLVNLKNIKKQMIQELKQQGNTELKEKTALIKQLQDEIRGLKEQIKQARLARREMEDTNIDLEELKTKLNLKQGELNDKLGDKERTRSQKQQELDQLDKEQGELQAKLDQMEKEKKNQESQLDNLKEQLNELKNKQDDLKTEISKAPTNLDDLERKLNKLNQEIQKLQEDFNELKNEDQRVKQELLDEDKKFNDLLNNQKVLQQQISYEKVSRQVLVKINDLEEKQRRLDIKIKELSKQTKQLSSDSNSTNNDLQSRILNLFNIVQKAIQDRNDTKDDLKILNSKILNKNITELKTDSLQLSNEKINDYYEKIEKLYRNHYSQEEDFVKLKEDYEEWESKIKSDFLKQQASLLEENKELILNIKQEQSVLIEKASDIDQKLIMKQTENDAQMQQMEKFKQKISQFMISQKNLSNTLNKENFFVDQYTDQNRKLNKSISNEHLVSNYYLLYKSLFDQNERLKHLLNQRLQDEEMKLQELRQLLDEFEKQQQRDKVKQYKDIIKEREDHMKDIDKTIDQLQSRIDSLQSELNKLDTNEDDIMKHEVQKQLEKLQNQLDAQKQQKEQLKQETEKLQKLDDDALVDQKLEEIQEKCCNIHKKALPLIEDGLFELEGKLKKAMNRKRNEKKKECQDQIDRNKLNLQKLSEYIDRIESMIKKLEKDAQTIQTMLQYGDLEREKDVEDKLKEELKQCRQEHQQLKESRDLINKGIIELDKQIELQIVQVKDQSKDEIVQQWSNYLEQSEKIAKQVQTEIEKAQKQNDNLDTLSQVSQELTDKFKFKDNKYRECIDNQGQKQSKIDAMKSQLVRVSKSQLLIDEQLSQFVDCPKLQLDYQDNMRQFQDLKDKIDEGKQRQLTLQQRLNDICSDLQRLNEKQVLTRDLQTILDELHKLDIEFSYEIDELNNLQEDSEQLIKSSKDLIDENRRLKLEDAEINLQKLGVETQKMDEQYKDCEARLQEYQHKIQTGLKENSKDEEVQVYLKKLRSEAQDIEKELKQLDRRRNSIKAQEKLMRDQITAIKSGKSKATAKDVDEIAENSFNLNQQAEDVTDNLKKSTDDLDQRIINLEKYLQKHYEITNLFKEFESTLGEANTNLLKFAKRLDEINDLSNLLKQVLLEMEKGVDRDYKLKEGFIKTELDDIQDIEDTLFKLDEARQSIGVQLQILKQDKMLHQTPMQSDADALQQLITEAIELMEKLEQSDRSSQQLLKRLNNIRKEIGIADITDLIQIREKEVTEFSGKLRKLETDFNDLKKNLSAAGGTPSKDIQNEIATIEKNIKGFRDDKVSFQRILGQDLQIFLPQPSKLENLAVLKEVVGKVIDLGDKTNKQIEMIDEVQLMALKLKRQVGGMDMLNRIKEVEIKENDQRGRLAKIRVRLEVIGKGALDCDGYTSNTEEATFIDTLLAEMPEMKQKQKDSLEECDNISNIIYEIRRDVEKQSQSEQDEKQNQLIHQTINQAEDQVEINEKTVSFLEKLCEKLEDHFLSMNVKKKLDKRQLELKELKNIGEDFAEKLLDMQEHLIEDIEKIQEKAKIQNPLQDLLVDENGKPVNLLEEFMQVNDELKDILNNVTELQVRNEDIRQKREQAQEEFDEQIVRNSPYKSSPGKITNKQDVFLLLKYNGMMKMKIIDLIKQLKDISRRMRDSKARYQAVRNKLEKQAPRKLYKALKGDLVDELFAEYINKLNCPVPIKRLGNNQYTFGTKKIFAKVINGKLVIRVGGGYMGIEEFMMYYGQQELQKIQKEEYKNTDGDLNEPVHLSGSVLLGDDFMADDETEEEVGRKSNAAVVDIDKLKEKLKEQSDKKKMKRNNSNNKSLIIANEEEKTEKSTIVGIGDVRKALKKNLIQIQTYEETSQGTKKGMIQNTENNKVENELRKIEQRVGHKLKQHQEALRSPKRPTTSSIKASMSPGKHNAKVEQIEKQDKEESSIQSKFQSKIPKLKK